MASDPRTSPGFSDWNSVFIKYCDGGSFTGANSSITIVNGTQIFYRGSSMCVNACHFCPHHRHHTSRILSSAIRDLSRYGIDEASDVVLAGCSAGALAVLLNIDTITRLLPASARVKGLSDAGYFIEATHKFGAESL